MEFKEATGEKRWPFRYTAPWVAVLQSILVLVQTAGGEKRCAGRAINAMIGKILSLTVTPRTDPSRGKILGD